MELHGGKEVIYGIRPQHVVIGGNHAKATVQVVELQGKLRN
jgi:multiple sugar transport system ATP-binding protein